jgi:hypothetical protein
MGARIIVQVSIEELRNVCLSLDQTVQSVTISLEEVKEVLLDLVKLEQLTLQQESENLALEAFQESNEVWTIDYLIDGVFL